MGRRQQRRDAEIAAAAAALTQEAAIVWRLLARYKPGAEPVYGAPLRCPDCGQFCLVLKVDNREGHCRNRCTNCGFEFTITERALHAVVSGQLPRPQGLVPIDDIPVVAPEPTYMTISAAHEGEGVDLAPPAAPPAPPAVPAAAEQPAPPAPAAPQPALPPEAFPIAAEAPEGPAAGRTAVPHHRTAETARRNRRRAADVRRTGARDSASPTDDVAPAPRPDPEPPVTVPPAPVFEVPALIDAVEVSGPATAAAPEQALPAPEQALPAPEPLVAGQSLFAGPAPGEVATRGSTSLFGAPRPPAPPEGESPTFEPVVVAGRAPIRSDAPAPGPFGAVLVIDSNGEARLVDPTGSGGGAPAVAAPPVASAPGAQPSAAVPAAPRATPPAAPPRRAPTPPLDQRAPGGTPRPLRILLVEDDPSDAALVQALLGAADPGVVDLRVATSRDAGEAAARDYEPHIVLLDLDLPDSHGLATITRWCFADIPGQVVVMSGDYSDAIEETGREQGVADFLPKSVIAELVDEGPAGTARVVNLLDTVASRDQMA